MSTRSRDRTPVFIPKSNGVVEANTFYTEVKQRHQISTLVNPKGFFLVTLRFFRQFATQIYTDGTLGPATYGVPAILSERIITIPVSDVKLEPKRCEWPKLVADQLYSMGIPEAEQPRVLEETFKVAQVTDPELRIYVMMVYLTVFIVDKSIDWDVAVALDADRGRIIPAAKSFIQSLEKLRLGSLEESEVQNPCAICWESLDHLDEALSVDHQHMITRLPCQHNFHADCIVPWLEINHLCPVCRYPMPIL